MMHAVLDAFSERLRRMPGDTTLYAKDLSTGETVAWRAETPVVAASVIKLPILAEAFRQARDGLLSLEERYSVRRADKMPSCGALTYLHDGLEVTLRDLCVLMIILSDNTATNLMIDRMGMENVNRSLHAWGLRQTALRRRLFDAQAAARGLQNTVTAGEMGALLERIYRGACVSRMRIAKCSPSCATSASTERSPFSCTITPSPIRPARTTALPTTWALSTRRTRWRSALPVSARTCPPSNG